MKTRNNLFSALLLFGLVIIAYLPALRGYFIWDDDTHVSENEVLRAPDGLVRIWTDRNSTCQYYPLTFSAFWLQYRLWGLNPLGYHAVNVLLHALDAILLWLLLRRLRLPAAWWAAAFFALHPVNVMSVAWITELKNVLSSLFMFLSTWFFLDTLPPDESAPAISPRAGFRLGLCYLLYVCALAAKTPAALTPFAWILILWWKQWKTSPGHVVFLLLALLGGLLAGRITAEVEASTLRDIAAFDLTYFDRLLVFGRAFWFYLFKLVWPVDLAFFYRRWAIAPAQLAYVAAAAGALLALWLARRRIGRGPFAALVYFTLAAPGILLVNLLYMTRFTWVADHWQYFGMPAILAWWIGGAARLVVRQGSRAVRGARLAGAGLLLVCGVLVWRQCGMYRDIPAMYQTVIARNPAATIAHYNLGVYHLKQGDFADAAPHFENALRLEPHSTESMNNLALALASLGDTTNALRHLAEGLRLAPSAGMHYNMAFLMLRQQRLPEAIAHFRETIRFDPTFTDAYVKLAYLLLRDNPGEAVALYREALRQRPDFDPWLNGLAWILATHPDPAARNPADAVALAEAACRKTGDSYGPYLDTLAAAYARVGRFADAVRLAEAARRTLPAETPVAIVHEVEERAALFKAGEAFTQTNLAAFAAPQGTREIEPSPAVDIRHPGLQ